MCLFYLVDIDVEIDYMKMSGGTSPPPQKKKFTSFLLLKGKHTIDVLNLFMNRYILVEINQFNVH